MTNPNSEKSKVVKVVINFSNIANNFSGLTFIIKVKICSKFPFMSGIWTNYLTLLCWLLDLWKHMIPCLTQTHQAPPASTVDVHLQGSITQEVSMVPFVSYRCDCNVIGLLGNPWGLLSHARSFVCSKEGVWWGVRRGSNLWASGTTPQSKPILSHLPPITAHILSLPHLAHPIEGLIFCTEVHSEHS